MEPDVDTTVKLQIYRTIAETRMPSAAEVAQDLGASLAEIQAAFARLHAKRLLVPEPGDPSRIRMAPPFSGIGTPFPVEVRGRRERASDAHRSKGDLRKPLPHSPASRAGLPFSSSLG